MTETTEQRRSGEVVTADATGWQHRNSLSVAAAAEDPSDGFACLQRVDVAVKLIQSDFFFVVVSFATAQTVVQKKQFEITSCRPTAH